MTPRKNAFALRELPLAFASAQGVPKRLALYEALREAVVSGRLPAASRLPASRDLARQLRVARGTVVEVYDDLVAEGYLRGARGAGTFVTDALPDTFFAPSIAGAKGRRPHRAAALSKRGESLTRSPFLALPRGAPQPFRPHTPAVEPFPRARWLALVAKHARRSRLDDLRDVDPCGHRPLRAALREHLRASRGVRCEIDQVVIVAGVHQALDLIARLVLDAGDPVWMEDPGYFGARCILQSAGARLVPVPVDAEGLDVSRGIAREPHARFAYVTPAHQAPLGATMSTERRARLLDWAARAGAWVFEDDYDSEFCYEERPTCALQALDEEGLVIHAGTLSKSLFPGIRLAYAVLPPGLVDPFARAFASLHRFVPLLPQVALTEFITAGDLARHLRRMRAVYAERRAALLGALATELDGELEIVPGSSGFELAAMLQPGVSDDCVNQLARGARLELMPLSRYAVEPLERGGLLLGFAAVSSLRSRRAVPRLRDLLRQAARASEAARAR